MRVALQILKSSESPDPGKELIVEEVLERKFQTTGAVHVGPAIMQNYISDLPTFYLDESDPPNSEFVVHQKIIQVCFPV